MECSVITQTKATIRNLEAPIMASGVETHRSVKQAQHAFLYVHLNNQPRVMMLWHHLTGVGC